MTAHTNGTPRVRIGNYVLLSTLGIGSFGKVKLAYHIPTALTVALKFISKRMLSSLDMLSRVKREVQYLRQLSHPHIIKLYEVINTPTDIVMVMEVARGELFEYIVRRGRMSESDARSFFQQLISAVSYTHHHSITHRDLKPENLLLSSSLRLLKIADFGLSNTLQDGMFLKTSCGSPNYAAPEVISGKLYAGPEVDVWSSGVILYVMVVGRLPFDDEYIPNLFHKINGGIFTIPSYLSPELKNLLSRMLVVDPLDRITIEEIKAHPWFNVTVAPYLEQMSRPGSATNQDSILSDQECSSSFHSNSPPSISPSLPSPTVSNKKFHPLVVTKLTTFYTLTPAQILKLLNSPPNPSKKGKRDEGHDMRVAYYLVRDNMPEFSMEHAISRLRNGGGHGQQHPTTQPHAHTTSYSNPHAHPPSLSPPLFAPSTMPTNQAQYLSSTPRPERRDPNAQSFTKDSYENPTQAHSLPNPGPLFLGGLQAHPAVELGTDGRVSASPERSSKNDPTTTGTRNLVASPPASTQSLQIPHPSLMHHGNLHPNPSVTSFHSATSVITSSVPTSRQSSTLPFASSLSALTRKKSSHSSSKTNAAKAHPKWHVGIRSRSPPLEVMLEIYKALAKIGMEWKVLSRFTVRCRYAVPQWTPPTQATDPNDPTHEEARQEARRGTRIELQLYKIQPQFYLVDFRYVGGGPQPVLPSGPSMTGLRHRSVGVAGRRKTHPWMSGESLTPAHSPPSRPGSLGLPPRRMSGQSPPRSSMSQPGVSPSSQVGHSRSPSHSSPTRGLRHPADEVWDEDAQVLPFFDVCCRIINELRMTN